MKKIYIFILILCLMGGTFYFIYSRSSKTTEVTDATKTKEEVVNNETNQTTEKQINNMTFKLPKENKISFENSESIVIDLKQEFKKIDLKDFSTKNVQSYFGISLNKNENRNNQSIAQWFEENNPEEEKQSIYSVLAKETIKIYGIPSYRVRYQSHPQLTGGFYDLITIYIPYKTDIYQIEYYSAPISQFDPDLVLSNEDIVNIQEYERIVEGIIQTIRFVE